MCADSVQKSSGRYFGPSWFTFFASATYFWVDVMDIYIVYIGDVFVYSDRS